MRTNQTTNRKGRDRVTGPVISYMGWIYIFLNLVNYKIYIGKYSGKRVEKRRNDHKNGYGNQHLYNAIEKYGWDNFIFDTLHYAPKEKLNELERQEIARFDCNKCRGGWGYNETDGGDGITGWKHTPETITKMSEASRESNRKRVKDGTHHLLDGEIQRKTQRKRVEDGTHPFLGGEINRKRIEDGAHNFLDSEFQEFTRYNNREIQRKYVAEGTHHLLRENHPKARPEYYQVYWEFVLLYPLGIEEARKHLREKFSDIPTETRNGWIRKWQHELDNQ